MSVYPLNPSENCLCLTIGIDAFKYSQDRSENARTVKTLKQIFETVKMIN
ncbi:hypothetical protein NIES4075_16240 [Tolypothrix sp. NIES-4075]|nr:hypothetical protein NIES4075_16240 [Tolypothrix sp. NIES-4075]